MGRITIGQVAEACALRRRIGMDEEQFHDLAFDLGGQPCWIDMDRESADELLGVLRDTLAANHDRHAELADQAERLADRIYMLWWAEKVRTPRYHRLLALSHRADARMFRRKDALKAVAA